jgi:hypothetical protein
MRFGGPSRHIRSGLSPQAGKYRYWWEDAVKISGCMAFDFASAAATWSCAVTGTFTGGRHAELLQA